MVAAEDAGEVTAEFLDFRVADVRVENLLQHRHLLRPDELFVIEESAVANNGVVGHVLDLTEHLAPHSSCFHWKITSGIVQWKRMYINLSPATRSSFPVEQTGKSKDASDQLAGQIPTCCFGPFGFISVTIA
jgi:hypothetical protein